MDFPEFRVQGKKMIDYVSDYLENIRERRVTPDIEPGYLKKLLPDSAPEEPEPWEDIMRDMETKIMPGVTHWQHPRFHAYFPAGNSFPSILGGLMGDAIGCIGFSWAASPACTELETIVLDWLGKAIGLPDQFLSFPEGSRGGGVIQTSASECILVSMLAARAQALRRLKRAHPFVDDALLLSRLMAYCSKEAHSCVEKAAMISFVKLRILEPDETGALRGKTLMMAMDEDATLGLVPFFVSTTLGTTSACSFDALPEIGSALRRRFPAVWTHVDAAYAGNAFILPELRYLLEGVEYADSFNMNPNKWMLTNFDCSTMWVRDRFRLTSALVVDPLYLQHGYSDSTIDYRHWGVPLSRRFRSLKLWFVLRRYGISGLREYVRRHIRLARRFEVLVRGDDRFEICNQVKLGLVCFRLKGTDRTNERLLMNINASGKLHMVPACFNERYVIRFCVVAVNANEEDIDYAWGVIKDFAEELLESQAETEKESKDEISELLERKKKETLAHKRSFFVRMVSDPKIYNPSIAKALQAQRRGVSEREPEEEALGEAEESFRGTPPRSASWISWPLAFLFQGVNDEGGNSGGNVPIRFRHLDTKLRLNPGKERNADGSSVSPEKSPDRSRRTSPKGEK